MQDIANVDVSEIAVPPDWAVSPHDYDQDTTIAYLITKCPGIAGVFGPGVTPYFSARFSKRLSNKRLVELTRP